MMKSLTALFFIIVLVSSSALIFTSSSDSFSNGGTSLPSKPVLAYFYGWYTKNAWYGGIGGPNSLAVADVPAIGLYNSQNVTVIDTQISEAESAGINGFIASWWGPKSFTDNTDQILVNEAASKYPGFAVSLYFETEIIQNMNSSQTIEASQIVTDVQYIMKTYGSDSGFMQIDGKPVLFFSGVDNWPVEFWTNVVGEIHSLYPSLLVMSDSLDVDYMSAFDGAASYVDLGYFTQSLTLQNGTYPTFTDLSQLASSEGKYWFATATPGFNGTNDGKTQFPVVARNDGNTFTIDWGIAQCSNPDGIIVGTWNEYYEGTSIEPAVSYGNLYLQLTSQLSSLWRIPHPTHLLSPVFPIRSFPMYES
jgi:hypothetical protein